ncbi:MAG: RnfABCDGE type electron transport complex subunit D [Tissierellia bacterium]|nr:RnfABCDGE type electron transport complex subunit D [Tissierellia bacterium]
MAPHIRSNDTVQRIMLDVIIALLPAVIGSIYYFGAKAAIIYVLSILSCVASEYIFQKATGREIQIRDLSAVVTGILFAMNLPATAPWYLIIVGGVFAIIIVKQLFGGIGGNFVNPALAARAMCMAAWPSLMTAYVNPDGASVATPLGIMKEGSSLGALPSVERMITGDIAGVIGETSAVLLLIGFIYLLVRRVIDWKVPVIYIATAAVFFLILGVDTSLLPYQIFGGGLMLGAIFMATDYSSTPMTSKGKIIFAIGCGLLTAVIRLKGSMAEGVSYSILLMNVASPLIDKFTVEKAYGEGK